MTIEFFFSKRAEVPIEPARFLTDLVKLLRPSRDDQGAQAAHALTALCELLARRPDFAALLRDALLRLVGERKAVSLLVDSGIQPSSGFFSELWRRLGHRLLPDAVDEVYLKDLFALIFPRVDDERWVLAVPEAVWLQLLALLRFEEAAPELRAACRQPLLDAMPVLSYRLSALGLEPELVRNYPELEEHDSPFVMQNVELHQLLTGSPQTAGDSRHLLVMLDQCRSVIAKIRRSSSQTGTSIHLTFLLQRMTQQIERLELLLELYARINAEEDAQPLLVRLFQTLVYAECHKNDVRQHCRENMELMALRVTENASRTGEHYITETRAEYYALMRSAMGAGVIVGLMAMLKIVFAGQHHAPLTEAIIFSLNYGLGFVLIHILHFTVATKQPAMTAAAIAASIDASEGKTREMDRLVTIIAQTLRSQTVAIIGNMVLALPMAMLIAWLAYSVGGAHFVSPEKSRVLLADIDPLASGALFYAGIAGVCLFLSGLIAGYHDNLTVYNRIPQRLRALGWLKRSLGVRRLNRVADYVENNLGALAGNFYFGCLLGGMSALGVLLGLPIDIRHITFSTAFAGFAFVGLEFDIGLGVLLLTLVGIWLIGTVNLVVSFALALYVAMKSRKVTFAQWRLLLRALGKRLLSEPRAFFLPPRTRPPGAEADADAEGER